MHLLVIPLVLLMISIILFLSLPYQVYIICSIFSFMILQNNILAIILLLFGIYKYKNNGTIRFKNGEKFDENFYYYHTYQNFNEYSDFNNHNEYNSYNNMNTSMSYYDACDILGVNQADSFSEKKKAYIKLTKKYHPDINKSDEAEEMFKKINQAFEIVKKHDVN